MHSVVASEPALPAVSPAKREAQPQDLSTLVESTLELPTMPFIASRVVESLEREATSARSLATLIEKDQGIAGKILKLCNSAFYGLQRQIGGLPQAVAILGFREVKHIVVAASMRYLYRSFAAREQQLWEHSVGVALLSHMLAQRVSPAVRDVAFLAGQMHDVGKVIMNNHDRERMDAVEARAAEVGEIDAEREVFGFTHPEVGALLLRKWNLPAPVEAVARYHHNFTLAASEAPEHAPVVACVTIADAMCDRLGVGVEEPPEALDPRALPALALLELDEGDLEPLNEEFAERFAAEKSVFL